jgi:DNA-binding transcriptional LysR family regulator
MGGTHVELRQIRHFLALMETRSYTRAAQECSLTPQALSKSISRFEEMLGVRLFDRDTRSVKPTLFADEIVTYARNIDAEARSLRRALDAVLGAGTHKLVVGTGAAAATKIVAEAILAVQDASPKTDVTVFEGTFETLMPPLIAGRIDIVVTIMTTDAVDRLVDYRVLKVERYHVYGRAAHPLAGRKKVPLGRVLDYPWITGADRDLVADSVEASFGAVGLKPPQPTTHTDSVSFAISAVLQSDTLFILPSEMVRREVEAGRIVAIDVDTEAWTRPTVVLYRRNSTRSPDAILFLRTLKNIIEAKPQEGADALAPGRAGSKRRLLKKTRS